MKFGNVLSPEGSLRKQTPKGSYCFSLMFFGIERLFNDQKIPVSGGLFFFGNVLFTGWVGLMGWKEYQKCPSIFFILCGYIDHVYVYLYI